MRFVRPSVSVGTKLTGAMLVVIAVVTSIGTFVAGRQERERLLVAKEHAASMVTELFAAGVTASVTFRDDAGVREAIQLLTADARVTYGVVWRFESVDGARVGEKIAEQGRADAIPPYAPDAEESLRVTRLSDLIVVDKPIRTSTGEVVGLARAAFSLKDENAAIAASARHMLITAVSTALGIACVLLFLTRRIIVDRLAALGRATRRFEEGRSMELAVGPKDEVGLLARSFVSMTETIGQREAHISMRNRDMRRVLDNVTEGLLTVRRDGSLVDERSRVLDSWFGSPVPGGNVFDYFATFSATTARLLRLCFLALDDDIMPTEVILDQMPKRFEHGREHFELDVLPIGSGASDGPVEQLLFVVRNVTTNVERERAEQTQREALTIFHRYLDDREGCRRFFTSGTAIVTSLLHSGPVERLRAVHTLKGNASLHGLDSIVGVCHAVESTAVECQSEVTPEDIVRIEQAWKRTRDLFEQIDTRRTDRIELEVEEHTHLMRALAASNADPRVVDIIGGLRQELAAHRLNTLAEQGRAIARRLGKESVSVETRVEPPRLRLPTGAWGPFWEVFPHVLRNTFDHGLELPSERARVGKEGAGRVELAMTTEGADVVVTISDDGPGIAWERIRERAKELDLPHETAADLEEALYADKLSTRRVATEVSGRGLGMGAVREAVRAVGGHIEIASTAGRGTTIRFVLPRPMTSFASQRPVKSRAA